MLDSEKREQRITSEIVVLFSFATVSITQSVQIRTLSYADIFPTNVWLPANNIYLLYTYKNMY